MTGIEPCKRKGANRIAPAEDVVDAGPLMYIAQLCLTQRAAHLDDTAY
jgi:hypothetical protein